MTPKTRRRLEMAHDVLSDVKTRTALTVAQFGFAAASLWNGNLVIGAFMMALGIVDLVKLME